MDRKRFSAVRISKVDASNQSPRIREEEGMSEWRWEDKNTASGIARSTSRSSLQSAKQLIDENDDEDEESEDEHPPLRQLPPYAGAITLLRHRRNTTMSPSAMSYRGDLMLQKMMNPHLDRDINPTGTSALYMNVDADPTGVGAGAAVAPPGASAGAAGVGAGARDSTNDPATTSAVIAEASVKKIPRIEALKIQDLAPDVPSTSGAASILTPTSHRKAAGFDDTYHSVYVAPHPKGLQGLVVLFQSPMLLLAIGIFSGVVGLFVDFWLAKIAWYHELLSEKGFWYFSVSALLAASFSAVLTHVVCPQAAGSGLPHMKVAISGVDMDEFMSLRCVVTKIVGLIATFAAGLSVGKEGPFIMISCGFASILMNQPLFARINNDETKRLEMLACACAAGVAATFGSPFGGVLFSVEVTSNFYMVRTLPRSFFAAIVGGLVFYGISENTSYGLFANSNFGMADAGANATQSHSLTPKDLLVFTAMGMVCGLGGALFNQSVSLLVQLRDRFLNTDKAKQVFHHDVFWDGLIKRLVIVGSITLLTAVLEFYGDSAWFIGHGSPHRIIATLFSRTKRVYEGTPNVPADEDSVLLSRSLMTFLPLKFWLTIVSVVLPIPAGLFTPTFVIGGIFGRLVGEAIVAFDLMTTSFEPFEFAIIGAGAFSSGVTHAISTAVILMELSHTDGLSLPVSVAILAAYFTAKRFTENVYDMLIATSHLPRLKKLPKAAYDIPAWEVMHDVQDMHFLTADSTYAQAKRVLQHSREPVYPIVDSYENLLLLSTVTRKRLQDAVKYARDKMDRTQMEQGRFQRSQSSSQVGKDDTTLTTELEMPINLLQWPIHFAFRRGGKIMDWGTNEVCERTKLTVLVNPSPFQVMEMTPMRRVDLLFRMLKLNNAYVTRTGVLVGVITRDRLMNFLGKSKKYRVPGLWSTMADSCLNNCMELFERSHPLRQEDTNAPKRQDYQPIA